MSKLRGLWIGDGGCYTGFATVNHNILERLSQDAFEIDHIAINYHGDFADLPSKWDTWWNLYPALSISNMNDPLGKSRLINMLKTREYDFVYILMDIWVIDAYLALIRQYIDNPPKIIVYFPVDGAGYRQEWFQHFDLVSAAYTYTQFGKQVVNDVLAAIDFNKLAEFVNSTYKKEVKAEDYQIDVKVIPHGCANKNVYKYLNFTKLQLAEAYGYPDLFENGEPFVVLNSNRNQERKRLDIAFTAFVRFAKDKPNAYYISHCGLKDAGWDLPDLTHRIINEENAVHVANQILYSTSKPSHPKATPDMLNLIYNLADVGLNTCSGEGWGLCQTEMAYLGKPQVVGNHSSFGELFKDMGTLADVGAIIREKGTGVKRYILDIDSVVDRLNELYYDKEHYKLTSDAVHTKFSDPYYDWGAIASRWEKEILNVVQDNIS
jgi:glycosyltransferase involved in cell wall biosynthesis